MNTVIRLVTLGLLHDACLGCSKAKLAAIYDYFATGLPPYMLVPSHVVACLASMVNAPLFQGLGSLTDTERDDLDRRRELFHELSEFDVNAAVVRQTRCTIGTAYAGDVLERVHEFLDAEGKRQVVQRGKADGSFHYLRMIDDIVSGILQHEFQRSNVSAIR